MITDGAVAAEPETRRPCGFWWWTVFGGGPRQAEPPTLRMKSLVRMFRSERCEASEVGVYVSVLPIVSGCSHCFRG